MGGSLTTVYIRIGAFLPFNPSPTTLCVCHSGFLIVSEYFPDDWCIKEQIFQLESNAKIIVAGDVNQLKIKDIMCQHNMEQVVRKPTRGQKVLEIFLTNCPHLWNPPKVFDEE